MSRTGELKVDIINRAYKELRISGLTKVPSKFELETALDKLENMAEEYRARNICTGYNLEDEPEFNSLHNLERKHWNAYSLGLAVELISTFGKGANDKVDPQLLTRASVAFSFLSSETAMVREVLPSSRMPLGSGNNRYRSRFRRYNVPIEQASISCSTNKMVVGEINNFTEHFDAYLNSGEVISTFTIEADDALSVVSSSNTNTDITYQIKALGSTGTYENPKLKFTVTTDSGRITIREVNFELSVING